MKKQFFYKSILFVVIIVCNIQAQWVQTGGLTNKIITTFLISNNNFFAVTNEGVYVSTDNGTNWILTGLQNNKITALAISGINIIAGTTNDKLFISNGKVYISSDNGKNWSNTYTLPTMITSIVATDSNVFIGSNGAGIFHSTDYGLNWIEFNNGLSMLTDASMVTALAISDTNIFIGTYGSGVFRSSISNAYWVLSSPPHRFINTLTVFGTDIIAGTSWSVAISTDNGDSWKEENSPSNINFFAMHKSNLFLVSSFSSIYISKDSANTWFPINTGLPKPYWDPYARAFTVKGSYLFVALTNIGGIWRRPLSEVITTINSKGKQTKYSSLLQQNYPNPFNPSTTISFSIQKSQIVELSVYDMLGKKVANLVNGYKQAGNYSVRFNASNLSSGVYIYKLKAGNFIKAKKLVFLK